MIKQLEQKNAQSLRELLQSYKNMNDKLVCYCKQVDELTERAKNGFQVKS